MFAQQKEETAELESPEAAAEDLDDDYNDEDYGSSHSRKRPRREAAVAAAKNIPRQPSPFELSPPTTTRAGPSNRKVSHSLIERRRRERINDCLAHLKKLVPQCQEEGKKKIARARERSKKRGRRGEDGDDEGEGGRGGLHKLEILQVRQIVGVRGTLCLREETDAKYVRLYRALFNTLKSWRSSCADLKAR